MLDLIEFLVAIVFYCAMFIIAAVVGIAVVTAVGAWIIMALASFGAA